jgi:hypothetical protein
MKAIDLLEALGASGRCGFLLFSNAGIYDSPEEFREKLYGCGYKIVVRDWEQSKRILASKVKLDSYGESILEPNAVIIGIEKGCFDVRYLYCVDE